MKGPSATVGAERLGWILYGSLVLALLLAASSYRRETLEPLASETTVLAQATSLVHDGDLVYERVDHDRHLFTWRAQPTALDLSSPRDGEASWGFDGPVIPALVYAPFVARWPRRGFALANALVLALAVGVAGRLLIRRRGAAALFWLLGALVLSPLLPHLFLANGMALTLSAVLVALALLAGGESDGSRSSRQELHRTWGMVRYSLAGLLLYPAVALSSANLLLLVLAGAVLPVRRRRVALALLVAGLAVGWLGEASIRGALGPGSVDGGRSWSVATGFPGVDFPLDAEEIVELAPPAEGSAWPESGAYRLFAWRLFDRLLGREGGLLLYFPLLLPWLLAIGGSAAREARWLLISGLPMLWLPAVVWWHPFGHRAEEVSSGGDFLPFYAGLAVAWVVVGPIADRRRRGVVALVAVLAVSGALAFLGPTVASPWSAPFSEPGAQVSAAAYRLPSRTTTSPPKIRRVGLHEPSEEPELVLLDEGAWFERRSDRLMLAAPSDFLLASRRPLTSLVLEGDDEDVRSLWVTGDFEPERGGGVTPTTRLELVPTGSRRHPLEWTNESRWVYRLTLAPGGPGVRALRLEARFEPLDSQERDSK